MSSHLQGGNGVQAGSAALSLPSSHHPHYQPPGCSCSTTPDVLPPCPISPAFWYCCSSHTEWVQSNTECYVSLGFFNVTLGILALPLTKRPLNVTPLIFPISLMLCLLWQIDVWCRYSGQTQIMQKGKKMGLQEGEEWKWEKPSVS